MTLQPAEYPAMGPCHASINLHAHPTTTVSALWQPRSHSGIAAHLVVVVVLQAWEEEMTGDESWIRSACMTQSLDGQLWNVANKPSSIQRASKQQRKNKQTKNAQRISWYHPPADAPSSGLICTRTRPTPPRRSFSCHVRAKCFFFWFRPSPLLFFSLVRILSLLQVSPVLLRPNSAFI
ncbi:unnamed protein product [Periconia digitata]|uniref:Uncharacterized protein n=1 Tax=Periconia digitata TaxID=1303443 RepID=A0A9W4UPZ9_9PLEO|nr:unnamed protein product [Periconia digitata]